LLLLCDGRFPPRCASVISIPAAANGFRAHHVSYSSRFRLHDLRDNSAGCFGVDDSG
jgi:hypothetical protein